MTKKKKLCGFNRMDLIDQVAERLDMTKSDTTRAIDAFLTAVEDALTAGHDVRISGLGCFTPVARPARQARNPRTGAQVHVPANTTLRFRLSRRLKTRLGAK